MPGVIMRPEGYHLRPGRKGFRLGWPYPKTDKGTLQVAVAVTNDLSLDYILFDMVNGSP